jgi:hypothetical protein
MKMQLLHQSGEIIAQRYRILDILGQGGVGTTYEAEDLQSNERVALKALSLRRMSHWKKMELFEREACILAQLNHPAIPRYLDYFQVDTPEDRSFYIAQQLAQGKSLAVLVESGWPIDEAEIIRLAIQLLEIIVYLQSITPPAIHRDIKPQNIIRSDNGAVFLVDFGAVQDTYHHTVTGGSTVVGTYGYMAPEQFRGQAELSTDLYGLGTTLLFLLTQKSPAELPQRKLKINFRSHVSISSEFADWLERMLEPAIANRFPSAKESLAVLRGEQVLKSNPAQLFRQPKHSRIALLNSKTRLIVQIPPVWLKINRRRFFGFLTLVCKVILMPLLLAMPVLAIFFLLRLPVQLLGYDVPIWLAIFLKFFIVSGTIFLGSYCLIGLWKLGYFLLRATFSTYIEIDQNNFRIQCWLLGLCYWKFRGQTKNISQIKLSSIRLPLRKKPITFCVLKSKLRKQWFGLFVTQQEKEWLVEEIRTFLDK